MPGEDIPGSVESVLFVALWLAFGVLFFATFVVWFLAQRLANPISKLVTETDKIRQFKLGDFKGVTFIFKEVSDFADGSNAAYHKERAAFFAWGFALYLNQDGLRAK